MVLPNQHICTVSTEPFLCHNVISTKIKSAGSFHLFLALHQAKLYNLQIERDDNHRVGMKITICGQNYYN